MTTYSFDSRNLLSWLENPFAERTTWLYDALRRVTTMTHGNLSVAEHDYDAGGRLTALRNLKSDRSVISIFTYSYDSVGNRTGVEEANGDLVTWSYDEAYQLTREERSGDNAYDTTFTYDGVGNRLTQVSSGAPTTYVYDAANELTTSEDASGATTFTYDGNGNTTGEIRPNADRVTYTWDIENHLTKVELPSDVVNTITLDGDGKRRSIEDSDGLRNIIWDAENILAEVDSGGATVAQYTMAPEMFGELVSQRRSGATSFHHFDALGSTNKLTDADEATLIEYLYRAFGQQTVLSGSSANRFTWTGMLGYWHEDSPTDFFWVRAATVLSSVGRRLGREPGLDEEGILYAWVGNDPINWGDPAGLFRMRLPLSAADGTPGEYPVGPFGPIGGPFGPIVTPAVPSLRDCEEQWKCAHEMVDAAGDEARVAIKGGRLTGRLSRGEEHWAQDALRHCTGICKIQEHCWPIMAPISGFGHEFKQFIWLPENAASRMDLVNNKHGMACADAIESGHYNGSCLDCCVKKYNDGRLRREPTPLIRPTLHGRHSGRRRRR